MGVRRALASMTAALVVLGGLSVLVEPAGAARKRPTVTVVKVKGTGRILADSRGRALYTLTADGAAVPCEDACLSAWPPLTTRRAPKAAKGVDDLGTTDDGQVTHDDLPLYRFAGDTEKGQATGEGINSFGGVWHVVIVKGTSNARSSPSSTPSTPGGSGSLGY